MTDPLIVVPPKTVTFRTKRRLIRLTSLPGYSFIPLENTDEVISATGGGPHARLVAYVVRPTVEETE